MLKNYIKIAFKVFLRRKFFTFISLFAISFTLVVLMVAASFLDHILGALPPETKQDRTLGVYFLLMTGDHDGNTNQSSGPAGYSFLDRYVRTLPDVAKVTLFSGPYLVNSYKNGQRIESFLKRTDGEYWQVLDFNFIEGAPYTADDDKNANFVAVINEATRKKFFGDESAVGKTIEADDQRFRVVGVVANIPFFRQNPFADIWTPISTSKTNAYKTGVMGSFNAMILAKSARDFPLIKSEFQSRLKQVELPDTYDQLVGATETTFENYSRFFSFDNEPGHPTRLLAAIVLGMVLFMLLPTLNLVNINISRIMERASEIGVRKAFGASSRTLVGQFVAENVMITLVGAIIGGLGSLIVLRAITDSGLIPYAEFHFNYRIFIYGLCIALFFGLFSGVYPAWKMSRLHPVQALNGGVR